MLPVRHPRPPLHVAATLFVVLVCLTVVGLDGLHVWVAREGRVQQAGTETRNLARSLAQHAQDVFESTDATLKGFRATLLAEGRGAAVIASLDRRMRTRVANQASIQRLFIYNETGRWIASSLKQPDFNVVRNQEYTDRDYFRYHRDHAEDVALIGPPIQTKLNGAWVTTITRRLNNPDGSFAGVVGASVPLDLFQRFFQTFDVGHLGAITLASGNGILIVRTPFDEANIGRNISGSEFFQSVREGADTGSFAFTSLLDGRARLGSFYRVPGFDLLMIVAVDQWELLTPWRHDAQIHLVLTALIIGVVGGIGFQITYQIRRRAAAEAQLALSQQTLERRVVERTADLQDMVSQRDLLLREVYHRVNNTMQVVDALLAMEMKHLEAPARQPLANMRVRILTFALAHQQLMAAADLQTFDIAPFLRELVDRVVEADATPGVTLSVDTISLMVQLELAVPLGLIVSEIMTILIRNELSPRGGQLEIVLKRDDSQDLVLSVSAVGFSSVSCSRKPGMSDREKRMIEGLVRQIDGIMTIGNGNGMSVRVVLPKPSRPA